MNILEWLACIVVWIVTLAYIGRQVIRLRRAHGAGVDLDEFSRLAFGRVVACCTAVLCTAAFCVCMYTGDYGMVVVLTCIAPFVVMVMGLAAYELLD